MERPDAAVAHGVLQLPLRQADVEPLAAGDQAVLASGEAQQRGENGRWGVKPERITHSRCGVSARAPLTAAENDSSWPPMQVHGRPWVHGNYRREARQPPSMTKGLPLE